MELWVCDRSGPYSCERFDAHKNPGRFIKVVLAYTMMSDEELGLNMFIREDDIGKCIMIKGEGQAKEERLDPEDRPIAFQRAIVCRGTTCYRAKRQGVSRFEFVVKFSWRSDKRRAEEELLQLAKEKHVWGVAELFGHRDLTRVDDLRHGLQFGKPRSFLPVCGGSSNQIQPKFKSNNLIGNLSRNPSVGSNTTTLPSSSSLGQKRKAEGENAAICQFKRPRSNGVRPTDPASKAAEKPISTSLMPSKDHESFNNRIFYCLVVSPPGRAIDQFESIEEYLEVCRDAIRGHQSLYQKAKILHRDVSKNNIIIADAENDGDPRGMLIDLDLAKELNAGRSGAGHRTGTSNSWPSRFERAIFIPIATTSSPSSTSFYGSLFAIIRKAVGGIWQGVANFETGTEETMNVLLMQRGKMDKFGFKNILNEFPDEFYGLQDLAEELRVALLYRS